MNENHIDCTFLRQRVSGMIFTCCFSLIILKLATIADSVIISNTHSSMTIVCPNSCYCDDNGEYVSCVGDGLWRFPMEIPNSTVRLELRNYLIKDLSSVDFVNLIEIEELKLEQSRIEIIDNNTFESNIKLQKLDLSQNLLTALSSSVFSHLIDLRYLDLSTNAIAFVEEAFMGLVNLEQLNLRDNKLQELTTNTFVGLHKVQYLNLDANNISAIEVGTFQYLTNLAHLIISNNPLTTLSRLDFFGSRLQYIDISHVGLDRIPQSLTKFVRDLRLAKNNLTHISAGDFDSYPYLGLLVLDDNCISEIENDALGRQEYLMRLWLNGNCLTKVPPNLPPSLLALYMEENKLTELTSYSFKGLVHLEQLFLQRNEIKYMTSCVFCDLISLKSLDLQANQIENLTTGVFNNLTHLQTLDLSQNNLKYIDSGCFDKLPHLTTLQMSRVHTNVEMNEDIFDPLQNLQTLEVYDSSIMVHSIVNSTRMLHGLRKVQELNIMHNHIVRLRSDFPSFFPFLKIIKLSGNSWHCDENIKWLSNWIKQSNVQFYSSYNIRCASPESILFKPLMMLIESDFQTLTTTTQFITSVSSETVSLSSLHTTSSDILSQESKNTFKENSNKAITSLSQSTQSSSVLSSSTISSVIDDFVPTHVYEYRFINSDQKQTKLDSPVDITTVLSKVSATGATKVSQQRWTSTTNKNSHSIVSHDTTSTTEFMSKTMPTMEHPKEENTSIHDGQKNTSLRQTMSPQRRVLSSRLRVAPHTNEINGWDQTTMIVVSGTLSGGCVLFVIIALTAFTCFRLRHRYQPVKHRNMRRSSSISYYPQKDEVSIVTLSEGTVGLRTTSHHGLGNKLYYIMENSRSTPDGCADSLPDSQLQELLPQTSNDSAHVY